MPIAVSVIQRIRIRSWKDVVLIFAIAGIYYGLDRLCTRVFNFSEKTTQIVCILVCFVIAVIAIFLIGD